MFTRRSRSALERFVLKKPHRLKTGLSDLTSFLGKQELIQAATNYIKSPYLYWTDIKYRAPRGLSPEDFWSLIKLLRNFQAKKTPIRSEGGDYFTWIKLPDLERFFHEVDLNTGGALVTFGKDITEENRPTFISRGVVEEAIASSQLEGANTTREVAKKLIREGRKPKTLGEQMILNNYKSMQAVEGQYKNQKLDLNMLLELHTMIVQDTDVARNEIGRFRTDKENIVVTGLGEHVNTLYHRPPKLRFVRSEIERFIKFANDEVEDEFIHPVIKAILLHFWVGYLHPFTNGNGRLARLLFYWYLLRKGYWAFAYLPISTIIKRSPGQYRMAYIYSEQDDNDLTYFVDYNVRKIRAAIESFEEYVERFSSMNKRMGLAARTKYRLNERQIHLLQYFHKKKDEHTTAQIHRNINQVSRVTAIKDLKELERKGFVKSDRVGREVYYSASEKIEELFG